MSCLCKLLLFTIVFSIQLKAAEIPSWFLKDTENDKQWVFYCEAKSDSDQGAEDQASQACLRKICELFGLEVESKTVVTENLKETQVQSSTTQSCQKIRVLGKRTNNKQTNCDDKQCYSWIQISYGKIEFEAEKKRLKELELAAKQNGHFKKVDECKSDLKTYAMVRSWDEESLKNRTAALLRANKSCDGISPEDSAAMFLLLSDSTFLPQGATYTLAQTLAPHLKLVERISAAADFFNRQVTLLSKIAPLRKAVLDRWESFFPGENRFDFASKKFKTRDGKLVDEDPYILELKTCKAISSLMYVWPGDFGQDLTVCLPTEQGKNSNDCQMVNTILMRARLAGCLCHLRVPQGLEGRCTQVLMQQLTTECPGEMTKECREKAAKNVAETLQQAFKID